MKVAAILGVNVLMLVLGAGLLPPLRLARTRRELVRRLPLAYAVGLAATGILAANLAVVHVPVGWIALSVFAIVSVVFGLRGLPAGSRGERDPVSFASGLVLTAIAGAFFLHLARMLAVKPLSDNDGWAIWGLRARALYAFGHPIAPVFTDPPYQALQHPLLLPALEALDFRAMRGFDGTVVHLQLLGFAIAFVGGAWGLLRPRVPGLPLAAVLLATITAPTFFIQLPTNYADVPLAVFVALGLASLATGQYPAAALFLGAGALTKNEGEVFALTAFIAAAIVAHRAQLRPLLYAALAVLVVDLPWRIWVQLHHVRIAEYSIGDLFRPSYLWSHRDRVGPSAHELWHQLWRLDAWGYVVPLVVVGLASGLLLCRFRLVIFAAAWLVLSFAGLLSVYWISSNTTSSHLFNSSDRTTVTLIVGGALLVAILLQREPKPGEL